MADPWWQELESIEAALASGDVDRASSGLRRFDDDQDWWRRAKKLRARAEALKLRLLLPKVAELEQAVVRRDAAAAEVLVRWIYPHTIYSDNEVYNRLIAVQPELLWLLFERLGAERLLTLLGQVRGVYAGYDWWAMEAHAEQARDEELLAWCRLDGWPSGSGLPRLHARLAVSDPQAALLGLVDDLARVSPADEALGVCATTLAAILAELGSRDGHGADLGPVRSAIARLDTRRGPRAARGVFGVNLGWHLPDAPVDRVSSRLDRGLVWLAEWYETRVRIEHMSPLVPLGVMLLAGVAGRVVLDASLGRPDGGAPASSLFCCLWISFAVLSQHTHVSREPTVGGSLTALAIWVTLPLCSLITGIAARLP